MICLTPDSYGVDLTEFNPCHDTGDGKFTVKGQGRCLGDRARLAARRDMDRFVGPLKQRTGIGKDELRRVLQGRTGVRSFIKRHPAPGYMQKDIQRAKRVDNALTMVEPPVPHDRSPGAANVGSRVAFVEPTPSDRRAKVLSVLRHEHGHIDRTKLGKGGSRLNGVTLDATQTEEVRAWKNAIRNSGGRVSLQTMRWALKSYFRDHADVHRMTGQRDEYTSLVDSQWWRDNRTGRAAVEKLAAIRDKAADEFIDTKIMPPLRRYARRVRRAARSAA